MELPASYYASLDKRNPVIATFERDINTFLKLMTRVTSSTSLDNSSYAKGIKNLVEFWHKYRHRLPSKMYQERMLQIADYLFKIKLYQVALGQGYGLHLLQFSSVRITDITDINHFMTCFFPEGFDTDQDIFAMKIRAMQGYALCVFELEKRKSILSQKQICKLQQVLNFIRIMMQAFQRHEHLYWQIYNGALHIYTICRYLMTKNCSTQALEYLLWASISLEFCSPLITAEHLPLVVTIYCAVCHCYYDSQAVVQAEEFARRALEKINELAKMEEQSDVPVTGDTQRAYKEASIKLAAMVFKRAVFETRRRPKIMLKSKMKSTLKDPPSGPWPRTTTERMLMGLFDSSSAQFLGILEALWDSSKRPLQTKVPDKPELQEVIIELLSSGISILSGDPTTPKSLSALTPTSSLIELALTGENKIPIMSAIRFIKLLFQYSQPDAFTKLAREMLQVLSGVEGQTFTRAELELTLLDRFNRLLSYQKSCAKEDIMTDDRHKASPSMSDEFIGLIDTLHKSVCGSAPEVQPDGDLVYDLVIFLWAKVRVVLKRDHRENLQFKRYFEEVDYFGKWLWCLSMLCEVAFACDLAIVDCIMTAEMFHTLAILLESAAEHSQQTQCSGSREVDSDGDKASSFCLLQYSSIEMFEMVCEVVERGREALTKGVATVLTQDCSAIIDAAFMQKFNPPSTPSIWSLTSAEGRSEENKSCRKEKEEVKTKAETDVKSCQHTQSSRVSQLAVDLYLELDVMYHRASLRLLQLNAVTESKLLDRIKKNKVSKALFLIQKALQVFNNMVPNKNSKAKGFLEEASTLIEKAGIEERKLYVSMTHKNADENKDKMMREKGDSLPPAPILLSRSDRSFTFAPAPNYLEGQVCWYQLCGCAVEGVNRKVRLGDCSLPGTGNMVPALSGECLLRVEGLEPNKKYVFAVAAYDTQGNLLGNTIGATTFPLLASMPVQLLSTWAQLAQAAFQTEQFAIAKRACRELWSHYTCPNSMSHSPQDRLAATGLYPQTLRHSSPHLCHLFLTSIFIETDIDIKQGLLYCDLFSDNGPFMWEQEARLAECERMLVAMDLAMWLNDSSSALQAVVICYGLLAPLIFHQIACDPVVQVLKKCLIVLEENSGSLKQIWAVSTSESLNHMIACITYYLSKTLRVLKEPQMASVLMECGRRLLQEVFERQLQISRLTSETVGSKTARGEMKVSLQMKALQWKKNRITSEATLTTDKEISRPLTGSDDPPALYDLISCKPLVDAYQEVIGQRGKEHFIEYAALLLQRTKEEGRPELVLKWGLTIFEFLFRRDKSMGLSTKSLQGKRHSKRLSSLQTLKGSEPPQKKDLPSQNNPWRKHKQNMPNNVLQKMRSNRGIQDVGNLLTIMSAVMQRHKRQIKLRKMCCEERVWKSQLNYSMAQAHLALLHQSLYQLHRGALQNRYSQLNPLVFSLAYSGILVPKKSQHQQSPTFEVVSERDSSYACLMDYLAALNNGSKKGVGSNMDSVDSEEGDDASLTVEEKMEMHRHSPDLILDLFYKAALHLRRAMVLAHRGNHWTILQCVCQTVWDQSCRITVLIQRAAQTDSPCPITADQLQRTFNSLLVLATDLIMDMLNRLGLWDLYASDLTKEELESSLQFSVPLDDGTMTDLRWVRTLVLHTLQCLNDSGKWETLAHFALVFNSYTRERYASILCPLIVHAQKKLLERIKSLGGPAVPQPHHVKTQKATGKKVTFNTYATCQLLSARIYHSAQQLSNVKHATISNLTLQDTADFKGLDTWRSMSLVCVPLDVDDTLRCFHQALERKPNCLQVFQHSRSLLLLHLAFQQPSLAAELQPRQSRSLRQFESLDDFSPIVGPTPNIQPCDLSEDDYNTLSALYNLPTSPGHIATVTAAYSTSIKYLQANGHDSLTVLALHEIGNLHFYYENTRAAHSYWSKAVDCALQSSGIIEKWDGVSFGGRSLQQTLKQAGIFGCLQAAGLAAKIAQYILTSDITRRTKCCLLSAHLFKCVLCCSLAQPQSDLQYVRHSIGEELLPGVDLFSEPHRVDLGTTITGLNFICHWLFTSGYYITLLPMLALYLHFVGTVCRDVQRTVEGKILRIRVLTELCLFNEAVTESVQLTRGTGIPLPSGCHISKANLQPLKTFHTNKPLLDNAEVLEEIVNCDFTTELRTLYGSTMCLQFNLAHVQLVLALSSTIHGPPVPDFSERDSSRITNSSVNLNYSEEDWNDIEVSRPNTDEPKVLTFDTEEGNLTPERMKFLLLEGASSFLHSMSKQLTSQSCGELETLELTIESKLLWANLYLQQGRAALSFEMVVSSLLLLQTWPSIIRQSRPNSEKPTSELPPAQTQSEQDTKCDSVLNSLRIDCSRAVEASERIGVSLWLRCRVALFRSLTAHNPGTASLIPGRNMNEEAARMLQESLDECAVWGDVDVQALLMVEGAELEVQRGKTDASVTMLQEAISLISEQTCTPPRSILTQARATLLLSNLHGAQSITLLKLTQNLLISQLCVFGECVMLENEKISFPPTGLSNIYLPYLNILDQVTLQIAQIQDRSLEMPVSSQSSQSTSMQPLQLPSSTE